MSLASRLLNARVFPCLCIVAHHGSQQTVQLRLDHYTGTGVRTIPGLHFEGVRLDADECLAEIINGVQHADQTLQYNR